MLERATAKSPPGGGGRDHPLKVKGRRLGLCSPRPYFVVARKVVAALPIAEQRWQPDVARSGEVFIAAGKPEIPANCPQARPSETRVGFSQPVPRSAATSNSVLLTADLRNSEGQCRGRFNGQAARGAAGRRQEDRGEPAGAGHCSGSPARRKPSRWDLGWERYVGSSLIADQLARAREIVKEGSITRPAFTAE
jgi:hypothetical protein